MNKNLFWKMCLVIAAGVVTLFWVIDLATTLSEEGMSMINKDNREQITLWGKEAELLYLTNDKDALENWLDDLGQQEHTWASIAQTNLREIAGDPLLPSYFDGYNLGRDVGWQIHLYMKENPVMEVPFATEQTSFLIQLPERMRPGKNLEITWLSLQIILPIILLGLVSTLLYRHIMNPLRQLQQATKSFRLGKFEVRAGELLGDRNDELSELAKTFDQMANRIEELISSQRQLIAEISHELRTPLTRLDISIQNLQNNRDTDSNLKRIQRESNNIRKLVEDSLTLAWLENERPELRQESLDLTDLLDVIAEDAQFEFPDRKLLLDLPESAEIHNSNHRSLGQALENILRNALRFTPPSKVVQIYMHSYQDSFNIGIEDQGCGVPEQDLQRIFQPFYRSNSTNQDSTNGFGLGLALAKRQISSVGGVINAFNNPQGGLSIDITLPKYKT